MSEIRDRLMDYHSYCGIPIIENRYLTEPVISLSPDLDVSEEFRAKCNAFYENLFGRRPAVYMVNDQFLAAHPDIVRAIKENLDSQLENLIWVGCVEFK